jgi:pyruvate dehydrogenase E1 component
MATATAFEAENSELERVETREWLESLDYVADHGGAARVRQPPFPGIYEIERRIRRLVRWNAMAMVVRANREEDGIGGHLPTYASACTLFEVAFNHFLRGKDHPEGGDQVYRWWKIIERSSGD